MNTLLENFATQYYNSIQSEKELHKFFHAIKREAFSVLPSINIPNRRDEEWKYTNLNKIFQEKYIFEKEYSISKSIIEKYKDNRFSSTSDLVFLNGFFQPRLSRVSKNQSISVENISGMSSVSKDLELHFSSQSVINENAFFSLEYLFIPGWCIYKNK